MKRKNKKKLTQSNFAKLSIFSTQKYKFKKNYFLLHTEEPDHQF